MTQGRPTGEEVTLPKELPESLLLSLFRYRNVSWRYLLCYCNPLHEPLLLEQLANHRHDNSQCETILNISNDGPKDNLNFKSARSSILSMFGFHSTGNKENDMRYSMNNDNNNLDRSLSFRPELLELMDHQNKNKKKDNNDKQFYHLPIIDIKTLRKLFKKERNCYEKLKKLYLSNNEIELRNECLRQTAPPSEKLNKPQLRDRSQTVKNLQLRDENFKKTIFTKIDVIKRDWKSQIIRNNKPNKPPPRKPNNNNNEMNVYNSIDGQHVLLDKKIQPKKDKVNETLNLQKSFNELTRMHSEPNMYKTSTKTKNVLYKQRRKFNINRFIPLKSISYNRNKNKNKQKRNNMFQKQRKPSEVLIALKQLWKKATNNDSSDNNNNNYNINQNIKQNNITESISMTSSDENKIYTLNKRRVIDVWSPDPNINNESSKKLNNDKNNTSDNSIESQKQSYKNPDIDQETLVMEIKTKPRLRSMSDGDLPMLRDSIDINAPIESSPSPNPFKSSQIVEYKERKEPDELLNTKTDVGMRQHSKTPPPKNLMKNLKLMANNNNKNLSSGSLLPLNLLTKKNINEKSENNINISSLDSKKPQKVNNKLIIKNNNTLTKTNNSLLIGIDSKKTYGVKFGKIGGNKQKTIPLSIGINKSSNNIVNNNKHIVSISTSTKNEDIKNDDKTEYKLKITSPPEYQLKQLEKHDESEIKSRMKFASPRTDIDDERLKPDMDYQRRRESVNLDEDDEEYKYMKSLTTCGKLEAKEKKNGSDDNGDDNDNDNDDNDNNDNDDNDNDDNDNDDNSVSSLSDIDDERIQQLFEEISDVENNDKNRNEDNKIVMKEGLSQSDSVVVDKHPLGRASSFLDLDETSAKVSLVNDVIEAIDEEKQLNSNEMLNKSSENVKDEVSRVYRRKKMSMTEETQEDFVKFPIETKANKELWTQIMKDVNRTLQYKDLFREHRVKHSLGNILYIWSRQHMDIGYLQGMNEIAAIIGCALHQDYDLWIDRMSNMTNIVDNNKESDTKTDNEEIISEFMNQEYFESDLYTIYSSLMKVAVKYFEPALPPVRKDSNNEKKQNVESLLEDDDVISNYNQGLYGSGPNPSLYLKLHYLQHKLLKHFDLVLYTHLENIGLQPQLYMMRWIRVLFSREFYVDQTILLWDELLVSNSIVEFIDYIVMAMIHKVRDKLLLKNDMTLISILQNYPRNEIDITVLANTAKKIQSGLIRLDFDKDLYSEDINEIKHNRLGIEAHDLLKNIDKTNDFPQPDEELSKQINSITSIKQLLNNNKKHNIDIRIPGLGILSPHDRVEIKEILQAYYGNNSIKFYNNDIHKNIIRMSYLVKRGAGDQTIFSRKSLKKRWFVIQKIKNNKSNKSRSIFFNTNKNINEYSLTYYKSYKSFIKGEEPIRDPVKLKGRAIRVVNSKYCCFEISGIHQNKRAYLLFASNFKDFILWLHALIYCADKNVEELV